MIDISVGLAIDLVGAVHKPKRTPPRLPPADLRPSRFKSLAECLAFLRNERLAGRIVWRNGVRVVAPSPPSSHRG